MKTKTKNFFLNQNGNMEFGQILGQKSNTQKSLNQYAPRKNCQNL